MRCTVQIDARLCGRLLSQFHKESFCQRTADDLLEIFRVCLRAIALYLDDARPFKRFNVHHLNLISGHQIQLRQIAQHRRIVVCHAAQFTCLAGL